MSRYSSSVVKLWIPPGMYGITIAAALYEVAEAAATATEAVLSDGRSDRAAFLLLYS